LNAVTLLLGVMLLAAGSLFFYVSHEVKQKRKAMQFITLDEKRRYTNLMFIGVTLVVAGLLGFATAWMGGGSFRRIELPTQKVEASEPVMKQVDIQDIKETPL
jgi:Trk-type K+ transport system membrane component